MSELRTFEAVCVVEDRLSSDMTRLFPAGTVTVAEGAPVRNADGLIIGVVTGARVEDGKVIAIGEIQTSEDVLDVSPAADMRWLSMDVQPGEPMVAEHGVIRNLVVGLPGLWPDQKLTTDRVRQHLVDPGTSTLDCPWVLSDEPLEAGPVALCVDWSGPDEEARPIAMRIVTVYKSVPIVDNESDTGNESILVDGDMTWWQGDTFVEDHGQGALEQLRDGGKFNRPPGNWTPGRYAAQVVR